MPDVIKLKKSAIAIVRDADGELQAYFKGDDCIRQVVSVYFVEDDAFGDKAATPIELEDWAKLGRAEKSAVNNAN